MSIDANQIHFLTKKALKGDLESAKTIINFLMSLDMREAIVVAYLIAYQIIMNIYMNLGEECKKCGGICCKFGSPIELTEFDLSEIIAEGISLSGIMNESNKYLIPRPCPFQDGWRCRIHENKPYACLSYPFAVEDIQKDVIVSWNSSEPPKPFIPQFCVAGQKTWDYIKFLIESFKKEHGKVPTPLELLEFANSSSKS
ncbi:YkgJ family cysteine cluster protein [Ignisphaera sp. 4213-co]|uniref:YkgJ family cysteine cluster protein n=1 Tax=Ignisphaera cupida TaxID=3050454 RepID=A0ABD4Z413_9CREN|nr:YkgJ family cysteine cluster protein [Ignisphaera sp. 4213-co]MDK6028051.1 YkgJ family cysteine cluster protein [Ignisphaera sp. 4213-co]